MGAWGWAKCFSRVRVRVRVLYSVICDEDFQSIYLFVLLGGVYRLEPASLEVFPQAYGREVIERMQGTLAKVMPMCSC